MGYVFLCLLIFYFALYLYKKRFQSIFRTSLDNGFIVQILFLLFDDLRYISLFQIIRSISAALHDKKNSWRILTHSYLFPELWVFIMLVTESVGIQFVKHSNTTSLLFLLLPFWRIIDIFVYQINVLLFDPIQNLFTQNYPGTRLFHTMKSDYVPDTELQKWSPNTSKEVNPNSTPNQKEKEPEPVPYQIKSASRTVILLILNMVEYVFLFTIIYGLYANKADIDFTYIPYQSFNLFTNLDGPNLTDLEESIIRVAYVESILGMFMNIVCLGRFIGMLPDVQQVGFTSKNSRIQSGEVERGQNKSES